MVAQGGRPRWDPVGVARQERQPTWRGAAHDDAVDCLLELPDADGDDFGSGLRRIGVGRRSGVEFDLDELRVVCLGGAVAVVGNKGNRRMD